MEGREIDYMQKGRRIIILCEGDTEELAVKNFIAKQWRADQLHSTGLYPINLNGKLQDISKNTRLFLQDSGILAVFTMVDLAGMDRVNHSSNDHLDMKVKNVKHWLAKGITHQRHDDFHPHVCVHETEAWILAEGVALKERLGDSNIQPDPMAEKKNFLDPPSKRINTLFLKNRGNRYRKIRDGRPLFANLQFEPVYNSCPYFRKFQDDLKRVATRPSGMFR